MSIELKHGYRTEDVRMDRIPQFDNRSKEYSINGLMTARRPKSQVWACGQTLDQGAEGACVGFGITHELIATPVEVKGLDNKYAREQIYWEAQKIDPWEGGAYPGASPFYEGTSVLAGVKIAKSLGWIDDYYWAFTFQDFKLGISYEGPAVIGVKWYEGMYAPDKRNYIRVRGKLTGGHCCIVRGIDTKRQRFIIHNSWGPDWGVNGDCFISYSDMQKLLANSGEAVFFKGRNLNPISEMG